MFARCASCFSVITRLGLVGLVVVASGCVCCDGMCLSMMPVIPMCKFSNSLTWSSSCSSCCALTGRLLGSFSAGAGAGAGACLGGCAGAGACLGGCAGSVVSKNETGFFVMVACGAFTTDMS